MQTMTIGRLRFRIYFDFDSWALPAAIDFGCIQTGGDLRHGVEQTIDIQILCLNFGVGWFTPDVEEPR
jgi:hypothetical protein